MNKIIIMQRAGIIGNSSDPSHSSSFVSQGGIDYLFGVLLILLGLSIYVVWQRKAKDNLEKYKKEQLKIYNKNKKTNISDYSKTSLYIPFWVKAKISTPIYLTVLFMIMGVLMIIWTIFGTQSSIL